MEFQFVSPTLRDLDRASAELLACCVYSDVRPMCGLAGLLDFRLAGRLSALVRAAFLGGDRDELLCFPGRPRLPFEKVLVLGLGKRSDFDDGCFVRATERLGRALEGVRVERAVVELPGRADDAIGPEHAAELLLKAVRHDAHDVWWVVERPESQRLMEASLEHSRRKIRRP